jgi:DNA polymerase
MPGRPARGLVAQVEAAAVAREQPRPPAGGSGTATAAAVAAAGDLQALANVLAEEAGCPTCAAASERLLGRGPADAELMCIGSFPSAEELAAGQLFCGEPGVLLDRMLSAMGFAADAVYLTTALKCRPPGFGSGDAAVQTPCVAYVRRQVALLRPKAILMFGSVPLAALLGLQPFDEHRGRWLSLDGIPCLATRHPAYLLRVPAAKRQVWGELQLVMQKFGREPAPRGHRA